MTEKSYHGFPDEEAYQRAKQQVLDKSASSHRERKMEAEVFGKTLTTRNERRRLKKEPTHE